MAKKLFGLEEDDELLIAPELGDEDSDAARAYEEQLRAALNPTPTAAPAPVPPTPAPVAAPQPSPSLPDFPANPLPSLLQSAPPPTAMQAAPAPEPQQPGPIDRSSRDAFIRSMRPYALEAERRTGIPADIMIAINLNEQGWQHEPPGNAYFGIKGSNPRTGKNTGPVATWEDYGQGRVNIQDTFRAYDSPAESYEDFGNFLRDNSRYANALRVLKETGDGAAFLREVHRAGYATDPLWSDKVLRIANDVRNVVNDPNAPPPTPYPQRAPMTSLAEEMAAGQQQGLVPPRVQPVDATFATPAERAMSVFEAIGGIPDDIARAGRNLASAPGRSLEASGKSFGAAGDAFGQLFDPNTTVGDRGMAALGGIGNLLAGILQPINPEHYIGADASNALAMTPLAPLAVPHTAPALVRAASEVLPLVTNLETRTLPALNRFGQQLAGIDPANPTGPRSVTLGMSAAGVPPPGGAGKAAQRAQQQLDAARQELAAADAALRQATDTRVAAAKIVADSGNQTGRPELNAARKAEQAAMKAQDKAQQKVTRLEQRLQPPASTAPDAAPTTPAAPDARAGGALPETGATPNTAPAEPSRKVGDTVRLKAAPDVPRRVTDIYTLDGDPAYQLDGRGAYYREADLLPDAAPPPQTPAGAGDAVPPVEGGPQAQVAGNDYLSGRPGIYTGYRGGKPGETGSDFIGGTYVAQDRRYAQNFVRPDEGEVLQQAAVRVDKPFVLTEGDNAERLAEVAVRANPQAGRRWDQAAVPTIEQQIQEAAQQYRQFGLSFIDRPAREWLLEQGYDAVMLPRDLGPFSDSGPVLIALDPGKVRLGQETDDLAALVADAARVTEPTAAPAPQAQAAGGAGAGEPPIPPPGAAGIADDAADAVPPVEPEPLARLGDAAEGDMVVRYSGGREIGTYRVGQTVTGKTTGTTVEVFRQMPDGTERREFLPPDTANVRRVGEPPPARVAPVEPPPPDAPLDGSGGAGSPPPPDDAMPPPDGTPAGARPSRWVTAPRRGDTGTPPPAEPPSDPPRGFAEPEPPPPPPPASSPLSKLDKMWADVDKGPTLVQRARRLWANRGDLYRGTQEQFTDQFAGINQMQAQWRKANPGKPLPLEVQTETLAALSRGASDAGLQRVRDMTAAVNGALGKVWDGARNDLDSYLLLKHAIDQEKVKGPGRKISGGIAGAKEAEKGLADLAARLGPERYARLEAAGQAAVAARAEQLDRMVESGLVSPELRDWLKANYPNYSPIRLVELAETGDLAPVGGRKLNVNSNQIKRLTEEGSEAARFRPTDALMESLMRGENLIFRNNAAKSIGTVAESLGIGKRVSGVKPVAVVDGDTVFRRPAGDLPGTISYMENGKRVVVEVPDWLHKEAQVLYQTGNNAILEGVSLLNEIPRKAFITYNPLWPWGNFMVDWLTVATTRHIPPSETFRGMAGAIRDVVNNDPVLAELRRRGGGQAGLFGKTPKEIAKAAEQQGATLIRDDEGWRKFVRNPVTLLGDGLRTQGEVLEDATRRSVFTTELKRRGIDVAENQPPDQTFRPRAGMTKEEVEAAFAEAALAARRGTIDFQRGGTAVKAANSVYLFLNAATQGGLLIPRMLRDSPRARYGAAALAGATAGLYAWNRQFPEYEDVPRDVRYGSIFIMAPSKETDPVTGRPKPNYLMFVPRTREFSLIVGPMTYTLEALDRKAQPGFAGFLQTLLSSATPVPGATNVIMAVPSLFNLARTPSRESLQQAAVDVMPTQPMQTLTEMAFNRDTFRGRDIETPELQAKPVTERYDQYTSETIKRIAQGAGLSPAMLQHFIYGLTGGAGRSLMTLTDPVVEAISPTPVDERIKGLADQLKALGPNRLKRLAFLNDLPAEDREKVDRLSRQPETKVPLVQPAIERFIGERSGELNRLGREAAEAQTGASTPQTQRYGADMGRVAGRLRDEQKANDKLLDDKVIDGHEWIDRHADLGKMFSGALLALGIAYPQSAQAMGPEAYNKYRETVATVAGQIPDRRERGQILAAAYRAIPMTQDPVTRENDYETFFRQRQEFMEGLAAEDRATLEAELDLSDTPKEREYRRDSEQMRQYFEYADSLLEVPAVAKLVQRRDEAKRAGNDLMMKEYDKFIRSFTDPQKQAWRLQHKDVDQLLKKWYGMTPILEQMAAGGGRRR